MMDDLNLMHFHLVRIMFTIFNTHFQIDVLEMCIDIIILVTHNRQFMSKKKFQQKRTNTPIFNIPKF
jgi:hypothetical protein